ncbi:MAG: hypothetical protein JNL72_13900 [Flavipsychrobacter sp.]|nr:hypothetical protein [Flavipsychrobacter sp.]
MTARILSLALAASLITGTAQAQEEPQEQKRQKTVNIGLVYPISTTGLNAPNTINYFSTNAIGGISYDERSFCASGVTNIVKHNANGVIAAGFSNHISNDASGLQAAGFMNTVNGNSQGVQAAGFGNYSGSIKGVQMGGFINITRGQVKGLQAAGFANLASDADVQLSGFLNRTHTTNTQFGGFINVAKHVHGAQVSGFINVAEKVDGVQLAGFINIADSCDYPIGLINIMRKGEMNLGVSIDESQTAIVAFRSGGKKLYGILGAGINLQQASIGTDGAWPFYALEGGLGAHINISRHFRVNLEGVVTTISDFYVGYYMRTSLRVMPSLTLAQHVELFAGPTINMEESSVNGGFGLRSNYTWGNNFWSSLRGLYIGAVGGISYKF